MPHDAPSEVSETSPFAPQPAPQIAPLWTRGLALLVDGLLWMPFALAVTYAAGGSPFWESLLLPAALFSFVVYQLLMHARYGATLGKRILRLRVVRQDDLGPIDLNLSIRRSLVDAVLRLTMAMILAQVLRAQDASLQGGDAMALMKSMLAHEPYVALSNISSLWGLTNAITAVFNPRRRALHDWIGGTVVVRLRKNRG